MKKEYYFSHDYYSRSDVKIVNLIMKEGMAGIGMFWCIVEMLYEVDGYIMLSQCERIAFELHSTKEVVEKVIKESGLFCFDEVKFWSNSVIERLCKIKERSEKARQSAESRWEGSERSANAMPSHTNRNANKVKKNKIKKNKKNTDPEKLGSDVFCKQVTEYYILKFTEKYGTKPALNFGKDYMVVKNTKNLFENESEWQNLIDYFLNSEKAGKFGATLAICFSSNTINLFKQLKAEPSIPKG